MVNPIKMWKQKRQRRRDAKEDPTLSLYLPSSTKRHQLTPSPSQESLVLCSTTTPTNPGKKSFFDLFPFEIRRTILLHAFGERIIHMDLSYGRPLAPLSERKQHPQASRRHACIPYRHGPESKQPKRWNWHSSVCHHLSSISPMGAPWKDICNGGMALCVDDDEWLRACFIGIMGWLLSCRQAYIEGIDVLYTTNTLRLRHTMLMRSLPRLLLPQRLSSVTSLDMTWDIYLFDRPPPYPRPKTVYPPPNSGLEAYHELLEMVPGTFPRLRRLFLSLQGHMGPIDIDIFHNAGDPEHYHQCDSLVMKGLENMLRKLGPDMEECRIAAETALYVPVKRNDKNQGLDREQFYWEGIWRELPEIDTGDKDQNQQMSKRLPGYWFYHGKDGYPPHVYHEFMVCMALGKTGALKEEAPSPLSHPLEA